MGGGGGIHGYFLNILLVDRVGVPCSPRYLTMGKKYLWSSSLSVTSVKDRSPKKGEELSSSRLPGVTSKHHKVESFKPFSPLFPSISLRKTLFHTSCYSQLSIRSRYHFNTLNW